MTEAELRARNEALERQNFRLLETNAELTAMLMLHGRKSDGPPQISYLFGKPLDEVAKIIAEHEDMKVVARQISPATPA